MNTPQQYSTYRKPSWAPPSWLFGPVWSVLYLIIAISFGYVLLLYVRHALPFIVLAPFILNVIFNALYTPIQFQLRNFPLALADILLVDATLIWALGSIYPYAGWVTFVNVPYLTWVFFATVLQATITVLNFKK